MDFLEEYSPMTLAALIDGPLSVHCHTVRPRGWPLIGH